MAYSKKLVLEVQGECLVPTSHRLNPDGYFRKRVWVGGKLVLMMYHRFMWEQQHGPVPEGHELDHKCKNRACCNTEHLQVLDRTTHLVNTNKERYAPREAEAKEFWQLHRCTGTDLASSFNVVVSTACGWIRKWNRRQFEH